MTNSKESIFSLKHVKKSFGEIDVLKDISLEVRRGEVVAVIGPSGSGKSTFLRCATLLEKMDSGELRYGDIVVAKNNDEGKSLYADKKTLKFARMHFGLVFQNFNLFPHYSILKNVCDAPICVQNKNEKDAIKDARDLIKKMGLDGKEDMVPCELSGGQQQRVAIARALAMHPDILFFDEPTSALDPELTREVLKVIRDLASEKMTMVIVTHEMSFARDVADRIIFMEDGLIIEQGDAQELINNPKHKRTKEFLSQYTN